MNNDSDCVLENSHIHDCGYGGCYFTCLPGTIAGVSSNNVARGNLVERTNGTGISLASIRNPTDVATNDVAENNVLIDCGMQGMEPHIACGWGADKATYCIIRNNTMYDTGLAPGGSGGGILAECHDSLVTNNTIRDVTDAGITVTGDRNTVSYNTISGVTTSYYSGIYLVDADNNESCTIPSPTVHMQ